MEDSDSSSALTIRRDNNGKVGAKKSQAVNDGEVSSVAHDDIGSRSRRHNVADAPHGRGDGNKPKLHKADGQREGQVSRVCVVKRSSRDGKADRGSRVTVGSPTVTRAVGDSTKDVGDTKVDAQIGITVGVDPVGGLHLPSICPSLSRDSIIIPPPSSVR